MTKIPLILFISSFLLAGCQSETSTETAKKVTQKVEKVAVAKTENKAAEKHVDVDEESGATLHKANCARCHGEGYYPKKPTSSMTSYDDLQTRVKMCDSQLGTELFPEELQKIGDYLNDTYYKFKK